MASQESLMPRLSPRELHLLTSHGRHQMSLIAMPSHTPRTVGVVIMLLTIFYQYYLKDFLFVSLGLYRDLQSIEDSLYTCRPIRHENLEGCEDIWLDDEGRSLYAACASSYSRTQWNPS